MKFKKALELTFFCEKCKNNFWKFPKIQEVPNSKKAFDETFDYQKAFKSLF